MTTADPGDAVTADIPAVTPKPRRRARLDIPRIRLLSWLGLESVLWGVVIAHLVKWAGNFTYFATVQVRYAVGYKGGEWTVWYLKDFWDRLAVHVQNGLPGIVAVAAGIGAAALALVALRAVAQPAKPAAKALTAVLAVLAGAALALLTARQLAGWHVHWFPAQDAPAWWETDRHYARDVGIPLVATILVQFLFTKPRYLPDDQPGVKRYLTSVPLALCAALVPIAILGVVAWKLPWLTHHGLHVPASAGAWSAEANGYVTAGEWIAIAMGVLGGIAARPFVKRVADDVQWFMAERSAGHIQSGSGLDALRGSRVIGTPIHRARVRWLIARNLDLPARNPWLVRGLLAAGFITLLLAGAGAWLTLAGPAAVH